VARRDLSLLSTITKRSNTLRSRCCPSSSRCVWTFTATTSNNLVGVHNSNTTGSAAFKTRMFCCAVVLVGTIGCSSVPLLLFELLVTHFQSSPGIRPANNGKVKPSRASLLLVVVAVVVVVSLCACRGWNERNTRPTDHDNIRPALRTPQCSMMVMEFSTSKMIRWIWHQFLDCQLSCEKMTTRHTFSVTGPHTIQREASPRSHKNRVTYYHFFPVNRGPITIA
jgi:hypothetical protein